MIKMKKVMISAGLLLSLSCGTNLSEDSVRAAEAKYQVKTGDTYWKIAVKNGVSVTSLMEKNNAKRSMILPGQSLIMPSSFLSNEEKDLLARLVHAEAEAEPYAGKVVVATVVLNRITSADFPNTLKEVIYQKSNGYYAFTPVQNGTINESANAQSRLAVNEALAFMGQGKESLFFYNPKTAKGDWIFSRETTINIGNHRFAK